MLTGGVKRQMVSLKASLGELGERFDLTLRVLLIFIATSVIEAAEPRFDMPEECRDLIKS